jgi:ABC-type glycerol-3-phosphate transport system permease component
VRDVAAVAGRVVTWLGAALVVAFAAAPLLYMIRLSLDPDPVGPASWPPRFSLVNYEALASPVFGFFPALRLSLLLTTGVTLVTLLVAVPAGYALARLGLRSVRWILPGMLALAFFAGVIILVTMRRVLAGIGLLDTLPGIGIAQLSFTVPLAVRFATYAFRQMDDDIEGAARLDGAGTARLILQIAVPTARPDSPSWAARWRPASSSACRSRW